MKQNTKASLIIVHIPVHLIVRPIEDIRRELANPVNRTLDVLAEQVYNNINNPDSSLDLLIAKLEAERKAQGDL